MKNEGIRGFNCYILAHDRVTFFLSVGKLSARIMTTSEIVENISQTLNGEFFSIKVVKSLHFDVNKHAIANKSNKVRVIKFSFLKPQPNS